MENAVDALKMAAGVLIFVLALSISINAFGETRRTASAVLDMKDRAYDYDFVHQESGPVQRTVGVETIIPSIYKAYKENYKIVFKFNDKSYYLYEKNDTKYYSIDLENEILGNDTDKEKFIKALLYGPGSVDNNNNYGTTLQTNYGIYLHSTTLYDKIKGNNVNFTEKIGVYYQEDIQGVSEDNPDANKTKKRVITYEEL